MAEVTELDDLDLQDESDNQDNIKRQSKRLKDLSQKVELTSKERDEQAELNKKLSAEKDVITKERDFFASFADSASLYPEAKNFKDKIKEKVMSGYSVEDATVSVLAKEGKLTGQPRPRETVAGGSAVNQIQGGGQKTLNEMTRDEKRQALVDAEAKGDISVN